MSVWQLVTFRGYMKIVSLPTLFYIMKLAQEQFQLQYLSIQYLRVLIKPDITKKGMFSTNDEMFLSFPLSEKLLAI